MSGFHGKLQSSSFLGEHITVVISIVAVFFISYVLVVPIILGVLGGLLLLLIVCLFATQRRLKSALVRGHKEGHDKWEDSPIRSDGQPIALSGKPACSSEQPISQGQDLGTIPSLSNDFRVFAMEELVAATDNFHDNNNIGRGGFGAVYKGTTSQGSEIAVKKLSLNSMQGKEEFMNEIKLVAKVQHRNLVKLVGCCAEGSERLIVYEYLPNSSLDKTLFDSNKRRHLDWQRRYSIILGLTRGLLYLHEDSHLRIVHRDIKASNILLDSRFNPKIADFGMARLIDEDESRLTTRPAGTLGYMAPEYAMGGQLSVKADVYSFGILLLELISGRKNFDFHLKPEMQILLEWVRGISHKGRNLVSTTDPVIIETCGDQEELALRCIHVGLLCTQAEASLRPSMSTINLMLSTPFMMLTDPTKPTFGSYIPTHDNKSTTNSSPSQPYAQHDPLGTLSSSVSSASAHTPIDSSLSPSNADAPEPAFRNSIPHDTSISGPSHASSTLSSSVSSTSSNNAMPPPRNIDGSATPMEPSAYMPERSKAWKTKFAGAKFWSVIKGQSQHQGLTCQPSFIYLGPDHWRLHQK